MLVLHAAWDRSRHALLVWDETDEPRSDPQRRPAQPFAASTNRLRQGWAAYFVVCAKTAPILICGWKLDPTVQCTF